MLTREEAQKIAAAINVLRPDWATAGLMTILADDRIRLTRSYRDTLLAFVALATDADSRKPTRIFVDGGNWWEVSRPLRAASVRKIPEDACTVCFEPEHLHVLPHLLDHEYRHPNNHARAVAARQRETK